MAYGLDNGFVLANRGVIATYINAGIVNQHYYVLLASTFYLLLYNWRDEWRRAHQSEHEFT